MIFALAINIFSFLEGVVIVDAEGNKLGQSVTAAQRSIVSTTFSRICIAAPGMCKLRVFTNLQNYILVMIRVAATVFITVLLI